MTHKNFAPNTPIYFLHGDVAAGVDGNIVWNSSKAGVDAINMGESGAHCFAYYVLLGDVSDDAVIALHIRTAPPNATNTGPDPTKWRTLSFSAPAREADRTRPKSQDAAMHTAGSATDSDNKFISVETNTDAARLDGYIDFGYQRTAHNSAFVAGFVVAPDARRHSKFPTGDVLIGKVIQEKSPFDADKLD